MANIFALRITPRERDLGGFTVRRILPYAKRRMVGPFIFLDEMGPAEFAPGETGIDVRPHPHIGLATITYLFDGEIRHRDSLGFDQLIRPGDVNLMTAGRGITHSERIREAVQASGQRAHGLQSWIALPDDDEDMAPEFHHYPNDTLPRVAGKDYEASIICGSRDGQASPVKTLSPTTYIVVDAQSGATIPCPRDAQELAVYVVSGILSADGAIIRAGTMAVFDDDARPDLIATENCRFVLIGGAPLGQRFIWWNLVASSRERIKQGRDAWQHAIDAGFEKTHFHLPPGETDFIPLPDDPLP